MYRAETLAAASGVKPKPGYFALKSAADGFPANQETIKTFLSYLWEVTLFGETYTPPTTQELQRLYDASTDASGDPVLISGSVFTKLVYDIILEDPNSPRWDAFIGKMTEEAGRGFEQPKYLSNMFKDAKAGKEVYNNELDYEIKQGRLDKETIEKLPGKGNLLDAMPTTPLIPEGDPTVDSLIELYIAYFNRAPEHDGIEYWTKQFETYTANGMSKDAAMDTIAQQFWPAAVQYGAVSGYRENMSNVDFVAAIYENVLGRPDVANHDADGLNYWVSHLEQGATKGSFVNTIIQAAYDNIAQRPDDPLMMHVKNYMENRIEVGRYFSQEEVSGHLVGWAATYAGANVLRKITNDDASVAEAIRDIQSKNYSTTKLQERVELPSVDDLMKQYNEGKGFATAQFKMDNDLIFDNDELGIASEPAMAASFSADMMDIHSIELVGTSSVELPHDMYMG